MSLMVTACPALGAETMLDWAKGRAIQGRTEFEDGEALPAEPTVPFIQRERGFALLGLATGRDRWRAPGDHRLGYDVRLDGELGFGVDGYDAKPYTWGTTSRLGLRFSLGGGSGSSHSELAGELSAGALLTLDKYGSGAIARISGTGVGVLEPGATAVIANVGVPFGFGFHRMGYHGEMLLWPSLGWATVVMDDHNRGSGPLFLGAMGRFGTDRTWFEGSFQRSAVEAEVDSTRFSICSRYKQWALCTDGFWLHVHDILDNEASSFARVGLRIGVGSSATRLSENAAGRPR